MQVKTLAFCLASVLEVSALCFWCSASALRIATAALGKESRCVSPPHPYMHCERTPWFCGYRDIHPFTGFEPKYMSMARKFLLMRSGQASPIPLGGNLSRSLVSSLPALFCTFRSVLRHLWKLQVSQFCNVGSASRGEPRADALFVNTTPHLRTFCTSAHVKFLAWIKSLSGLKLMLLVSCSKNHPHFQFVMSRSCAPLLGMSPPVPLSLRTPSLPHPSLREQQPCNPRHGGR